MVFLFCILIFRIFPKSLSRSCANGLFLKSPVVNKRLLLEYYTHLCDYVGAKGEPVSNAYKNHLLICRAWRKAGRPNSNDNPAKHAKLESQRLLRKLLREEEANKAKAQHDDLIDTHKIR